MYAAARKASPSVVFLDEFDALCVPRDAGESGAERRLLSTVLSELDGLESKEKGKYVLTVAATNVPWLIDVAALSRFEKRIHVPLPDLEGRLAIFEINITKKGYEYPGDLRKLAERSVGCSGREIARICREATGRMIDETNVDLVDSIESGPDRVAQYEIRVRPLTDEDFDFAFSRIKPEIGKEYLKKYEEFSN